MADCNNQLPLDILGMPVDAGTPVKQQSMQAHLDELRQRNQVRLAEILRHNVRPDQLSILAVRLNTLVDVVLGDDPQVRTAFEIDFEQAVGKLFDQVLAHANQAKLLAPAQPHQAPPGLIVPGR